MARHCFAQRQREMRPGRGDMRAAAEYRKHAEECKRLAQQMVAPEDKRCFGGPGRDLGNAREAERSGSRARELINQQKERPPLDKTA
jgi:hypothetical protein